MLFRVWLLGLFAFGSSIGGEGGRHEAPSYTSASIVNAATNLPGALAPNTIASLYGVDLAYITRAVSTDDIRAGIMPVLLPGTGVRVEIGGALAHIYYVSPTQVNLLIPNTLRPGPAELQLTLDGRAGPAVKIQLVASAPALFRLNERWIVACRPDGSVITEESPAHPNDMVVLYATGLGRTSPNPSSGELPRQPALLERLSEFQVLLNEEPVNSDRIAYAGVAPGFAGLYQINLRMPGPSANPEVRLKLGSETSPPGGLLPFR